MEGRLWLFRMNLILFDRLLEPVERKKIKLDSSPFWLKVGLCPFECGFKDLMQAIEVTFGGVIRAKSKGDYWRICVQLNVQKPLRRGIFVLSNDGVKS